ncbi:hypothetical protein D3C80_1040630 [compost metagenome]
MTNWLPMAAPKSSRPTWQAWPCNWRVGASHPISCAGSTNRPAQRLPRRRTCWRAWGHSNRAAATTSAITARPWPSCRLTHASPICCCVVRAWGWPPWPAMWRRCSVSGISSVAAVPTCTAGWPWSAARARPAVAARVACSAPGSLRASTVGCCAARRGPPSPTPTIRVGLAPCWRWPIPTGSRSSGVQGAPSIAWPTAVLPCSARSMR